jgi:hypothetical protein
MTKWLIAVAALLAVTPARAEVDKASANYILPHCTANAGSTPKGSAEEALWDLWIEGYCSGIINALGKTVTACIPDEATTGQARKVIVKYISDRPARMHESFISLAIEALTSAWPCKPAPAIRRELPTLPGIH